MIELRNLTKYYPTERGRKYVFRDLNVTFPGGHSIGVMGRNGAASRRCCASSAASRRPTRAR
jgi:capsular polysaccharide transport system ATP-binding protein